VTSKLKILKRQQRVLELRCKGLTIPAIAKALKEQDKLKVGERTIWKDLHSKTAEDFVEELKRQQLADIAQCGKDYKTRLQYRADMLDKLLPKRTELHAEGQLVIKMWQPDARPNQEKTNPEQTPPPQDGS